MNIFLKVLQVLISLHTLIGAIWKFFNTAEQTMPSLKIIPNIAWVGMGVFEIICSVGLILPLFKKDMGKMAPLAAIGIAVEMIALSLIDISSGEMNLSSIVYWIIVALICAFIAYGRKDELKS